MTLRDAVVQVLRDAGTALRPPEIAERAISAGLWATKAKKPSSSVESCIAMDIKHHGAASPFQRVAPSTFVVRPEGALSHEKPSLRGKPTPAPVTGGPEPASLSFTEAAERVLRESAKRKPMHYRVITETALARGWLRTEGQTPEATMYAQIHSEIERRRALGRQPRFQKLGRGLIGLTEWLPQGLVAQIEDHNRAAKRELRTELHHLTAPQFEALVGRLVSHMGFEDVVITPLSGDGGIDVRAVLVVGDVVRLRMAIQAKKWKANVRAPQVQQVRGSLGPHDQGMVITTSGFSSGAIAEARRPDAVPVALVNGEQLVELLVLYEIGVERAPHDLLTLVPDGLAEQSE